MNLKKKFVIGAASVALVAGMGGVAAPAAVADPSLPGSIAKLARLGGLDRVQTSLEVAAHQFGDDHGTMNPKRLYVVSAAEGNMVDAATAGMLTDGPIVFVYNNSYVATAVGKEIAANIAGIKEVVAIGGDGVISDNTLNAVKDAMKVKKTSRLAGKDRYETSVAIADYIYTQSIKGDKSFENRTAGSGNFLNNAYLANGANEHVVDSMVAGTLDNGAILLTQPDGKIPESVAEFIKKTLPTHFAALGGTGAVADATVNEAWVIKALGNKWETSYSIPNLQDKIDELEKLIKGVKGETGTDMSKPEKFGGLKFVVETASANNDSWQNAVSNEKQQISNWFVNSRGATSGAAYAGIQTHLQNLYGPGIVTSDPKFFKLDADKNATGVDYEAIEATQAYKDAVKAAEDELDRVWADKHQGTIANPIAVASQKHKTASGTPTTQLAQIAEVAKYTLDNDKKWLDASEKQLASLKGEWRGEYDKIAPKTVQRLGGADRFETAQLIANWYAKGRHVSEAYIANGTRLADSLAAGQLMGGPILLVRNDTKIPDFTTAVAKNLLCWTDKARPISVYGVGGTGVLSDDVLSTMVNLIGTKSACKVKSTPKATGLNDAAVKAYPGQQVDVDMHVAGDKNDPTLSLDDITTSDKKTSVMGTGVAKIEGVANQDKAGNAKTGTIHFTVGANVAPGTYYASVHDANDNKATVTITVENSFVVTPTEFTGIATDSVTLSAKLNGTPKTYNTDYTCTPSDASVKVSTAGVVSFDAPKMVDGKEVTLTCKAGKAEAKVKVIGYTNQIAAAAYTAPTLTGKTATPVANTAKTAGATYSYVVKTDTDNLTVEKGGQMSITIDPATGDLTVTDAGWTGSTAKTVVVTVTASKSGMAPKDVDVTINTKRA